MTTIGKVECGDGLDKGPLAPMMSSNVSTWETPDELFQKYHKQFNFTVDAAADKTNHKLPRWFGPGGEQPCGIEADWSGERVWLNPPYGRRETRIWVERAVKRDADIAVMLLPSRTSNAWFHNHLWKKEGIEIEFIKGRLKFVGAKWGAPFPSMIAIIR